MRHQRQGWRRLVALSVAMVGALVIAPGIASAGPNSIGVTGLVVDDTTCLATVNVAWAGQPGRLKTYMTELFSDADPTSRVLSSGDLTRSATFVLPVVTLSTYGFSNQFHAVTHVYDGKGVEQDMWSSNPVAASCI